MAPAAPVAARLKPLRRSLWFFLFRLSTRVLCTLWFRYRRFGWRQIPRVGPALLVSNHASHLDPLLIGAATSRRLRYLGRSSLFRPRIFAAVIRALGGIPVEREGVGLGGTRAVLSALAGGSPVVMFPEGTRSTDGTLRKLRPGAVRIAQKSGVLVVPVWIEGSGRAFPRGSRFPRLRRIEVRIGVPYRVEPDLDVEVATSELREHLLALSRCPQE